MILYNIVSDRTRWTNSPDYELLTRVEYTEEEVKAFRESIKGYVICDSYSWSSENDYEDTSGWRRYYHEIKDGWMLISSGKVVGLIFLTDHYTHAMSNVKSYDYNAIFFDKANSANKERWNDSCELYYNTTRSEDSCRIYIIKESEMPEGEHLLSFPISNIRN